VAPGPGLFQPAPDRWNAAARFASHNEATNPTWPKVDLLGDRDLRQMQRVGGCAAEHAGLLVENRPQPRQTRQPAARQTQATQLFGGFEGRPETQERAKRKREENPIPGSNSRRRVNPPPIPQHPLPTLGRVQPAQRTARRPARPVTARVAPDGKRQIGAVRRVLRLVCHQLMFPCEGKSSAKLLEVRECRVRTRLGPALSIERIVRGNRGHQVPQLRDLALLRFG
jgi:hypothetical protein